MCFQCPEKDIPKSLLDKLIDLFIKFILIDLGNKETEIKSAFQVGKNSVFNKKD